MYIQVDKRRTDLEGTRQCHYGPCHWPKRERDTSSVYETMYARNKVDTAVCAVAIICSVYLLGKVPAAQVSGAYLGVAVSGWPGCALAGGIRFPPPVCQFASSLGAPVRLSRGWRCGANSCRRLSCFLIAALSPLPLFALLLGYSFGCVSWRYRHHQGISVRSHRPTKRTWPGVDNRRQAGGIAAQSHLQQS